MRNTKGFTLVELIVTMAVTTILLGAVYLAVNSTQRHSAGIERKVLAQQDVKSALEIMAMEIGMASYNPSYSKNFWQTTACAPSSSQTRKGIQEATTTALTIEMDLNGNATVTDANEIIRYEYVTADGNRYITRRTGCNGTPQPFLGATLASGDPRNVRVINQEMGLPVFRYVDGSGNFVTTAAGIPNIRRIEITLAVETEHVDPNTGQRKQLIYSTSVIPRNHVIPIFSINN